MKGENIAPPLPHPAMCVPCPIPPRQVRFLPRSVIVSLTMVLLPLTSHVFPLVGRRWAGTDHCISRLPSHRFIQRKYGPRALGIGQGFEVGAGRAGRIHGHDSGRDFFVVNPKAIGRFAHDQIEIPRIQAPRFKNLAIHNADRARGRHDTVRVGRENSGVARTPGCARARGVVAIREQFDINLAFDRGKARFVYRAANGQGEGRAHACAKRGFNGRWIDYRQERAARVSVFKQALENGVAIPRRAGRGGVRSIGKYREPLGLFGQANRVRN